MPRNVPLRNREVYFAGAGLSCALELPNTAMLLDEVLELAGKPGRWRNLGLRELLLDAFKFFYPDAVHDGYRPDVVDFFSSLRTYLDVAYGLPGGFQDASRLYRGLKSAIAHLLIDRTRSCDALLRRDHPYLGAVVRPGNIVITSNWDTLIERYAALHGVPVRLTGIGDADELVVLKLHGSCDWCLGRHATRPAATLNYATLGERMFAPRDYRPSIPGVRRRAGIPLRIRALENWGNAWQMIRSRASEPLMITMARGKSGDLGPLGDVWRHAYGAVSRAERLEIVGYSMPPDDIEIRTLLRAGVQRGGGVGIDVAVRNPSPEVHVRVRQFLDRDIVSNYMSVGKT